MRASLIFPLSLVAMLAATGCSTTSSPAEEGSASNLVISSDVIVTEADSGQTIDLKQGENLVVQLKTNPSSGYRWWMTKNDLGEPSNVTYLGDPGASPGAWTTIQLTWSNVQTPGPSGIRLAYGRNFGPTILESIAATFELTVNVIDAD